MVVTGSADDPDGYSHEHVRAVVGCSRAVYEKWVALLGSTALDRPLTRTEAVAVGAVEHLRQRGVSRRKLERHFVRLALHPPPGHRWLLVKQPRGPVEIVTPPLVADLGWRKRFQGAVFDPRSFLDQLG